MISYSQNAPQQNSYITNITLLNSDFHNENLVIAFVVKG